MHSARASTLRHVLPVFDVISLTISVWSAVREMMSSLRISGPKGFKRENMFLCCLTLGWADRAWQGGVTPEIATTDMRKAARNTGDLVQRHAQELSTYPYISS